MNKVLLVLISITCFSSLSHAQVPVFDCVPIDNSKVIATQNESYSKSFTSYIICTIKTDQMEAYLNHSSQQGNGTLFNLNLVFQGQHNWALKIALHDIRASNYILQENTVEGVVIHPKTPAFTYRGYNGTNKKDRVILTIRKGYFSGYIQENGEYYYIEPASKFDTNANKDQYVLYNIKNTVKGAKAICNQNNLAKVVPESPNGGMSMGEKDAMQCTEMGVAFDQSFKSAMGSTINAENEITSRLNLVSDHYETNFNIEYKLVTIYECINNEFIADSITESCLEGGGTCQNGTVLKEFANWGNTAAGFGGVARDVATFWTNRNLKNGTNTGNIGYSFFAGICNGKGYNIVEDFFKTNSDHATIWNHELGHTWNASHVAIDTIHMMSPWLYAGKLTPNNRVVSASTQNSISSHRNSRTCLANGCTTISAPITDFTTSSFDPCTGEVSFKDESAYIPTSWSWNFGDTSSVSTSQNPTHTYTANGIYTVSLIAENAVGADTETKIAYVTITILNAAPSSKDTSFCLGDSFTLLATGSNAGTLKWYDSATNGTLLSTGSSYSPNPLPTSNTTYYVQEETVGTPEKVGFQDKTCATGGFYNTESRYMVFDVFKRAQLISVKVYAADSGSRTFELQDSAGTTLQIINSNLVKGEQRVTLNWDIDPGTNYRLYAPSNSDLFRNNEDGTANYPFSHPSGLISITCNDYEKVVLNRAVCSQYYYYFYDWEVSSKGCSSPIKPVKVSINPLPIPIVNYNGGVLMVTNVSSNAQIQWIKDGSPILNATNTSFLPQQSGLFTVEVTDSLGCKGVSAGESVIITGVQLFSTEESVKFFPNPVREHLIIQLDNNDLMGANLKVENILGKTVISTRFLITPSTLINLSQIPSGVYFVTIKKNDFFLARKIIKE